MSWGINYRSKKELMEVLKRFELVGYRWNSGHKPTDLSWNDGVYGAVYLPEGNIYSSWKCNAILCGGIKSDSYEASEIISKPMNYILNLIREERDEN